MPGHAGVEMIVRHRLGTGTVEIVSPAGRQLVSHTMAPPGCGAIVCTREHAAALEVVVVGQFSTARPCDRKANKPPGTDALAARARLLGLGGAEPTVDLEAMADVISFAFPGTTDVTGGEVPA